MSSEFFNKYIGKFWINDLPGMYEIFKGSELYFKIDHQSYMYEMRIIFLDKNIKIIIMLIFICIF